MREALILYRLQQLDTAIDSTQSRLSEIALALSDHRLVHKAEKQYEIAQEQAKAHRIQLKQIEDKVEAQRIKRKTSQASLFSGKIKNPKELQDLQMETEALKRYIAQLEDEQLEAMIAYETAEKAEKQAEKKLQQTYGTAAEENASLLGEQSKLQQNLEKLLKEKDAALSAVPANLLQLYQKLRKTKRGIAVTTISDGGCSTCGQALTPADLQLVRASANLIYCPSCGRILFQDG